MKVSSVEVSEGGKKSGVQRGGGEGFTVAPPRRTDIRLLIKPSMVSQGFLGSARCASSPETRDGGRGREGGGRTMEIPALYDLRGDF